MTRSLQRAGGRAARVILLGLVLATTATTRLDCQEGTVSATMLRVLAEAADVYRTGRAIYLVADFRFPHNVVGGFATRDEANRVRADSGSAFGVFGPYITAADSIPAGAPRVVSLRMMLQTSKGTVTVNIDPARVDAIFLSMSAVDKFLVPYYSHTYGSSYADSLRINALAVRAILHSFSIPKYPGPDGLLHPFQYRSPRPAPY